MCRRFVREAQAAAALDHPHVVPLYEVGEVGPIWYMSAAYCPGPTLASWLAGQQQPVSARAAAQLVATLADAVSHMHSRGVVHRDLKPANVLLQIANCELQIETQGRAENASDALPKLQRPRQEHEDSARSVTTQAVTTQARFPIASQTPDQSAICHLQSAIPKITDFGLAKVRADAADQPVAQPLSGTPRYMAPEQAAGHRLLIGPATDVHALGAILYELLTRRPPYEGASALETLHQVTTGAVAQPRLFRANVPRDLEAICLKCL